MNVSHASYQEAWDFQLTRQQARAEDRCPDTLVIVEHEPVFTLGRGTKDEHWKRSHETILRKGIQVFDIKRGGSVTYHGPGQIVCYPVLQLRNFCPGPKAYVEMLQKVIIRVLAEWKIQGYVRDKFPGVWIKGDGGNDEKISAIGVRIAKGVTIHGLALNVNNELSPFELITPCGIEGCQVTSMARLHGEQVDILKVRERLSHHFAEIFELEWVENCRSLPSK